MRLTIGQLAAATGVPASAIRFWERHGLLPAPERQGGQRRYPPQAAERIVLLRTFQRAGLSLAEVGEFQREQPHRQVMIRAKLDEIERRRADLDHAHQLLTHALRCGKPDIVECPTFRDQLAGLAADGAARPDRPE
ncbi:MerR family transcriptional regulator [Kitasatospora phosalacinea]|uniref:MerR family transcriptional regulator n=1 Tax=Kitasatospora phosalacinea TaxID=2065 RepID=UPI00052673A9|nr:MerR family transcriptional regulator [Kitasatospora phosalacinea]